MCICGVCIIYRQQQHMAGVFPLGHFKAQQVDALAKQRFPSTKDTMRIEQATTLMELEAALGIAKQNVDTFECRHSSDDDTLIAALHGHIKISRIRLAELAKVVRLLDTYELYWQWALENIQRHRVLIAPRNMYNYLRGKTSAPLYSDKWSVRIVITSIQCLRSHTAVKIGQVYRQLNDLQRVLKSNMGTSDLDNTVSILKRTMSLEREPSTGFVSNQNSPSKEKSNDEILTSTIARHLIENGGVLGEGQDEVSPGASLLHGLQHSCSTYTVELQTTNEELTRVVQPKRTAFWTKVALTTLMLGGLTYRVYQKGGPVECAVTGFNHILDFVQVYVMEPIGGIYDTLMRPGVRSGLRSTAVLEDLESLNRMVRAYVDESGSQGDYIIDYENAIRSPIRSVVFGQLIRLMLIQVQKQKVDMNRVLSMTDGILEQHELNFHVMALMPVVLTGALTVLGYGMRRRQREGPHIQTMRSRLRDVEIIINRCRGSSMNFEDHGRLLLHVHAMRLAARPLGDFTATILSEDLDELEDDSTDRERRLRTIDRMYRTYDFLSVKK